MLLFYCKLKKRNFHEMAHTLLTSVNGQLNSPFHEHIFFTKLSEFTVCGISYPERSVYLCPSNPEGGRYIVSGAVPVGVSIGVGVCFFISKPVDGFLPNCIEHC